MKRTPQFISGITAEDARKEIEEWLEDEYRWGRLIDQNRMSDLEYTIKVLENG